MSEHYILDGKRPVQCDDLLEWGRWMERVGEGRRVALTEGDGWQVSTAFLGSNHRFGPGAPLLFETMIFGGPRDGEMDRYATWGEAEAGHARMVVVAGTAPEQSNDEPGEVEALAARIKVLEDALAPFAAAAAAYDDCERMGEDIFIERRSGGMLTSAHLRRAWEALKR